MKNQYARLVLAILSLLYMLASPVTAAEDDLGAWVIVKATVETSDKTSIVLEAQPRFANDASRLGQLFLGTAIAYKLDDTTKILGGYAYIFTDPEGPASSNEHRIWQQFAFRIFGDGKSVTLSGSARLEQRFFEGEGDVAVRLRPQLKLTAPINDKLKAILYSEPFIGFTDNDVQADGIHAWRNFAGINIPLGKKISLEPGYLNQYVVRNGEDRMDHIAVIGIKTRF